MEKEREKSDYENSLFKQLHPTTQIQRKFKTNQKKDKSYFFNRDF